MLGPSTCSSESVPHSASITISPPIVPGVTAASVWRTGSTGAGEAGTAEYADYLPTGGGPARLSFERYSAGTSWEVSLGRVIGLESLSILHS